MPTIHVPQKLIDKIDEKLVQLITEGQCKIKRTTVHELAVEFGIDQVTLERVIAYESGHNSEMNVQN